MQCILCEKYFLTLNACEPCRSLQNKISRFAVWFLTLYCMTYVQVYCYAVYTFTYYTVCRAILCNIEHSDVLLLIVPPTTKIKFGCKVIQISISRQHYSITFSGNIFSNAQCLSHHCSGMPLLIKLTVNNKVEMRTVQ